MNIGIFGMGYVGFATLASLLINESQCSIYCFDNNIEKINNYKQGVFDDLEKEIKDILVKFKYNNFYLSNEIKDEKFKFDIVFICVGTPTKEDGYTDLSYIYSVFNNIFNYKMLKDDTEIIIKSTVPIGTCKILSNKFHLFPNLVFIPEFLREGTALYDVLNPSRIVVGTYNKNIPIKIKNLMLRFKCPFVSVSYEEAETIKYACNNFLALKISFINTIKQLCDKYEINMDSISYAMGLDKRIGVEFLQSGIGFGGGCLPKDNSSLITQFEELGLNANLLKEIRNVNSIIPKIFSKKIEKLIIDKSKSLKKISVLRCTFKGNTNDIRDSQTIKLILELVNKGFEISIFEKLGYSEAKNYFKNFKNVTVYSDIKKVLEFSDIVVMTVKDENLIKRLNEFKLNRKLFLTPYESVIDEVKFSFEHCIKL